MNVVWEKNPVTAGEIYAALPREREWKQKTVNTFLARLVEKGVLAYARSGKANVYAPLLNRDQCVAAEGETFLHRVFKGAAGPLVMHFCERAELSEQEIEELQALLRAKKAAKS